MPGVCGPSLSWIEVYCHSQMADFAVCWMSTISASLHSHTLAPAVTWVGTPVNLPSVNRDGVMGTVNGSLGNLRSGPGTVYAIVGQVQDGSAVAFLRSQKNKNAQPGHLLFQGGRPAKFALCSVIKLFTASIILATYLTSMRWS